MSALSWGLGRAPSICSLSASNARGQERLASRIRSMPFRAAGLCALELVFIRIWEVLCIEAFPSLIWSTLVVICMCLIAECMSRNWDRYHLYSQQLGLCKWSATLLPYFSPAMPYLCSTCRTYLAGSWAKRTFEPIYQCPIWAGGSITCHLSSPSHAGSRFKKKAWMEERRKNGWTEGWASPALWACAKQQHCSVLQAAIPKSPPAAWHLPRGSS